jgi:hypothetical protein
LYAYTTFCQSLGAENTELGAEVRPPSPVHTQATLGPPSPTVLALPASYPATRSRTRRLLQTYCEDFDALPEAPAPLPPNDNGSTLPCPTPRPRTRLVRFETPVDTFGRYRIYAHKPLTIPDSQCVLADFSGDIFTPEIPNHKPASAMSLHEAIAPCPNLSTFYFLHWFWKGSNKSIASREELRTNVILKPDFKPYDLASVNLQAVDRKLAEAAYSQLGLSSGNFEKSDGWIEKPISIEVPILGKSRASKTASQQYVSVPGMMFPKWCLYAT